MRFGHQKSNISWALLMLGITLQSPSCEISFMPSELTTPYNSHLGTLILY